MMYLKGNLTLMFHPSFEEINELRSKIQDMQMEIDILKETNQSTKKSPRRQHGNIEKH